MFGDVTRHVDARAQYDDRIRNSHTHTHSHTSGSLPKPYRKVGPKKYSYLDMYEREATVRRQHDAMRRAYTALGRTSWAESRNALAASA